MIITDNDLVKIYNIFQAEISGCDERVGVVCRKITQHDEDNNRDMEMIYRKILDDTYFRNQVIRTAMNCFISIAELNSIDDEAHRSHLIEKLLSNVTVYDFQQEQTHENVSVIPNG